MAYTKTNKSERAEKAISNGERPLKYWTKSQLLDELYKISNFDFTQSSLDDLKEFLSYTSWHHIGTKFRKVDFYKVDDLKVERFLRFCRAFGYGLANTKRFTAFRLYTSRNIDDSPSYNLRKVLHALKEHGLNKEGNFMFLREDRLLPVVLLDMKNGRFGKCGRMNATVVSKKPYLWICSKMDKYLNKDTDYRLFELPYDFIDIKGVILKTSIVENVTENVM